MAQMSWCVNGHRQPTEDVRAGIPCRRCVAVQHIAHLHRLRDAVVEAAVAERNYETGESWIKEEQQGLSRARRDAVDAYTAALEGT